MFIANPIYDSAFKFLMKDLTVARHFISVLLNRTIDVEGFEATEDVLVNHSNITGFSSQRMGFHATIIEEDGKKRKVLIELQKSHTTTDISRFRRYLAKGYYDSEKIQKNHEHQEIITIYILGFPLDIPVAVVKTSTKLIDASTQQELDANTDDEEFIRKLHHESIFVDVTKLSTKMQTRVDRLLSVFNQQYISENNYILNMPAEEVSLNKDDFLILDRLNFALQDAETRHNLIVQAEFQEELQNSEDKAKKLQIIEVAKNMKEKGLDNLLIKEITNLSIEELNKIFTLQAKTKHNLIVQAEFQEELQNSEDKVKVIAKKERDREIAKVLKNQNIDIAIISNATGLSIEEIQKL